MPLVLGAGLPRSGTTMLARCLNLVTPTHHECLAIRAEATARYCDRWRGGQDISFELPIDNDVEVGFFWSWFVDRIDAKVIYLWRPYDEWVRSATAFGLYTSGRMRKQWLKGYFPLPGLNDTDRLIRAWCEHHRFVLDARPDAYLVRPDAIVWDDLFSWLGWQVPPDTVRNVQGMQRSRPNRAKRPYRLVDVPLDERATSIQVELEARTRFSREEAVHPA